MQVNPTDVPKPDPKPKKKKSPPGPGLKVSAFIDLMRRLAAIKEQLSNEQVQFVQNAMQRFENETEGQVKTKHALPKPKKAKKPNLPSMAVEPRPASDATRGFLDRMVKLASEDEMLDEVRRLSDPDAERIAREQGLRATSPEVARAKIAETIVTLRDIERIAGAGTPPKPVPTVE
jgi:hypothetical protein